MLRGCWKGPAGSRGGGREGAVETGANSHDCSKNSIRAPIRLSIPCRSLSAGLYGVLENPSRQATVPTGQQPALEPAPTQPERRGRHLRREEGQRVRRNVTEAVLLQRRLLVLETTVSGRERLR